MIPVNQAPNDGNIRHLLGIKAEQRGRFYPGRVQVRASTAIAASFQGQIILWWLANLLARQFSVIRHIGFDVPSIPMRAGVALFGHEAGLQETLTETVAKIAGEKVSASADNLADPDIVLHVCPSFGDPTDRDYAIWGEGWLCAAGGSVDAVVGDDQNAVGPMLAAALGAAEAFQRITDWRGEGRIPRTPFYFSAWDGKSFASWNQLTNGPLVTALQIEPFYLCGAGAVGQALAATLAYFPGRKGYAVVLDGDPLDPTNLNRYCLSHLGSPPGKAETCKAVLENASFLAEAKPHYWDKYTALQQPRTKSPTLNAAEAKHQYRLIVSCVDKNPARHSLQNMWPRFMLGGSTAGLTVKVSSYDCTAGECLKCANPVATDRTIEEEASALRKMTEVEREGVLDGLAQEKAAAVRAYLADPGCGHAAEQFLTELGEIRQREFSVGFVSVASGILLGVALIQHALRAGDLIRGDSNHFAFSFLNRKPGRHFFGRDNQCDCAGKGGALFKKLWSD